MIIARCLLSLLFGFCKTVGSDKRCVWGCNDQFSSLLAFRAISSANFTPSNPRKFHPFIDCSRNGIIFSSFLSWKVFRLGWYNKCNFKVLYNLFILHWLFGGESYFPPPWFLDSKFTFFREVSGLSFQGWVWGFSKTLVVVLFAS